MIVNQCMQMSVQMPLSMCYNDPGSVAEYICEFCFGFKLSSGDSLTFLFLGYMKLYIHSFIGL